MVNLLCLDYFIYIKAKNIVLLNSKANPNFKVVFFRMQHKILPKQLLK